MYNQNLYYPKYYPNFVNPYNNYAYYNPPSYTAFYKPYTNNLPNYNYIENNNTKDSKVTNDATLESNFALSSLIYCSISGGGVLFRNNNGLTSYKFASLLRCL